ncbi:TNFRSF6B [Branchiostoma lanceolatum]|uniref:TNFRSF6B protein n=1 Tax=Branchiostoma lanceolatum TaxID=7740 RepID=A0A8K0EGQ5_BRALA|nr:TNFRSF6B [Branchiostoma lanceolatum]
MDGRCDLCPRGHYMIRQCENGVPNSTVCKPCEGRTYLPRPNHNTACISCYHPNTLVTTNNISVACRCRKGFYKKEQICWPNAFCPPGTGVHEDSCQRCPVGTFSDEYSDTQHCRPLTNCTSVGQTTLRSGTPSSDTVCSSTPLSRRRHNSRVSSSHLTTRSAVVIPETGSPFDNGINNEVSIEGSSHGSTITVVDAVVISSCVLVTVLVLYVIRYFTRRYLMVKRQRSTTNAVFESPTPGSGELCTSSAHTSDSGALCRSSTSTLSSRRKSIERHAGGCRHNVSSNGGFYQLECPAVMPAQTNVHESSSSLGLSDTAPSYTENSLHAFLVNGFQNENVDRRYNHKDLTEPMQLGHSDSTEFRPPGLHQTVAGSCQSLASTDSCETSASSLAYRRRIHARLAGVYTEVLSKGAMEHLVAGLGQEWKTVAHRLGLSQPEVDHILNANKENLEKQIYEMIRGWQQCRAGHASIAELYGVLLECNRQDLINQLMLSENVNDN